MLWNTLDSPQHLLICYSLNQTCPDPKKQISLRTLQPPMCLFISGPHSHQIWLNAGFSWKWTWKWKKETTTWFVQYTELLQNQPKTPLYKHTIPNRRHYHLFLFFYLHNSSPKHSLLKLYKVPCLSIAVPHLKNISPLAVPAWLWCLSFRSLRLP